MGTYYEDEFERVYAPLNLRRLDVSTVPNHVIRDWIVVTKQRALERAFMHRNSRQTAALGTMPHVHVDVFDTIRIGGKATIAHTDGVGYIGINYGSYVELFSYFNALLMDREALKHIGDIGIEGEAIMLSSTPFFEGISKPPSEAATQPVSPSLPRLRMARVLADLAIMFLLDHELAHIRNGHVGFLRKLQGLNYISEGEQDGSDKDTNLTLQSLEMDADSWASVQTVMTVLNNTDLVCEAPEHWARFSDPRIGAIEDWIYAVLSLFRLFQADDARIGDFSTSHPSARIRQAIIVHVAEIKLRELQPELDWQEVGTMLTGAVLDLERAYARRLGRPLEMKGLQEAFSRQASDHLGLLNARWATLVPHLREFSFATDLFIG